MGYGLPAPGSRLSAPWRLGDAGARCVCVLDRVSMRLAVRMPRALCVCKHGRGLRADQGTRRTHTTMTTVELPFFVTRQLGRPLGVKNEYDALLPVL